MAERIKVTIDMPAGDIYLIDENLAHITGQILKRRTRKLIRGKVVDYDGSPDGSWSAEWVEEGEHG